MKKLLTIAGSDCSGGAGIQADLKTFAAHGCYGMSAITALTAQNTLGVTAIHAVPPDFVAAQLDAIFTDIAPDAVKIGMVANGELAAVIAAKLKEYEAPQVVLDPVMVSTSGSRLLEESAMDALRDVLIPAATLITPNRFEAELLSGLPIGDEEQMEAAALAIARYYSGHILIKGGHSADNADDLLYSGGEMIWLRGERIDNPNTHGTGCTLSSAIACNLAAGATVRAAVRSAKLYLTGALKAGLDLGAGPGPLDHIYQF